MFNINIKNVKYYLLALGIIGIAGGTAMVKNKRAGVPHPIPGGALVAYLGIFFLVISVIFFVTPQTKAN